jgi:hypothetical protein
METKPAINSQTIQGILMVAIPFMALALKVFGLELTPDEQTTLVDLLTALALSVIGLWGIIRAVNGRLKADKQISGVFK